MKDKKTNKIVRKKKSRIDTYSTMFDIDFIVANEAVTLEELRKLYCYTDDDELEECYTKWDFCTGKVKRKSDGAHCILVKYNQTSDSFVSSGDELLDLVDGCSHEATHIVLDIYAMTSTAIDMDNQENCAYFIGYCTERILKTLLNK